MFISPIAQKSSAKIATLTAGDIIRRRRTYDPVLVSSPLDAHTLAYKVIEARFLSVRYDRDFGKVEAMVEVTYSSHPSAPPRTVCLLTSVPSRGIGQRQEFRQRLVQRAVSISVMFDRLNKGDTTLRAA